MPTPILMPQLSPTMEEGTLAKWHVKEGDKVRSGDIVAEIETDKATMELEAAEDGVIEKLLLAEGTAHVPVNHPIALLMTEDERAAPRSASSLEGEIVRRSPERETIAGEGDQAAEQVLSKIAEQIRRNDRNGQDAKRIFASPLARRLARELGLELAALNGSGPHGRIVKSDVERAVREHDARLPSPSRRRQRPSLKRSNKSPSRGRRNSSRGAKRRSRTGYPTARCSRSMSPALTRSCRTTRCEE